MVNFFQLHPVITDRTRRRIRNRKSTRGTFNSPFKQFMEATEVIRKVVKYVFIIWALVFGIVALFYLPSFTSANKPGIAAQSPPASLKSDTGSTFKIIADNELEGENTATINSSPATLNQPAESKNNQDTADNNGKEGGKILPNDSANNSIPQLRAARSPANTDYNQSPDNRLSVSAYKAALFSAIDIEQPRQTPLRKGTELTFIALQGEWVKVQVTNTAEVGFIHSSQVNN